MIRNTINVSLLTFTLLIATNAFAEDQPITPACSTCDQMQKLNKSFSDAFGGSSAPKSQDGDLYGATSRILNQTQNVVPNSSSLTNDTIIDTLTNPNPASTVADYAAKLSQQLASVDKSSNKSKQAAAEAFSITSLLGQAGITKDSQTYKNAQNFIAFVSGQTNPINPLPKNIQAMSNPTTEVLAYRNALAAYATSLSVGLNVFNTMLENRVIPSGKSKLPDTTFSDPLKGGANSTLSLNASKNMSQLQLDQYMANRRVGNSQWYKDVDKATPVQLMRENVIILAEIRYEMFQQRLALGQMNATLAASQLGLQQGVARAMLSQMRNSAIQAARGQAQTSGEENNTGDED